MSAAVVAPGTRSARIGTPTRRTIWPVVGLVALMVLSFAIRLRLITHGASLAASDGYDDGVYYAAADALVHGRLPYRDFLLLHPPGIVLALAPAAALGALLGDPVGVIAGRLAFLGIGAVNTGMVALIAARHSRAAAVVAGVGAAIFYPLAYAERSTLLEPLGSALILAAVLALRRLSRRQGALVAGLLAGLSVDVKIWYIVPLVLIGLIGARRRLRFFAAAAGGAAVVALPFFVAAPAAMFREIVVDQLGRAASSGWRPLLHRVAAIGSDPRAATFHTARLHVAYLLSALVLTAIGLAAVAAWRVHWARLHVVLAAATSAVLLVGPSFFLHYVGFTAPWMLVVLGVGTAVVAARLRGSGLRAATVLAPVLLIVVVNAPADLLGRVVPQPVAVVHAALAGRSGCVVSDDPGLLANTGLLTPALRRGCPLRPDVTGWTYDRDQELVDRKAVPRTRNALWQRDLMGYLTSGTYVILNRADTGLSEENREELAESPVVVRDGSLVVYDVRR